MKANDKIDTFETRLNSLMDVDTIRLQKFLEMIQYAVCYFFTAVVLVELIKMIVPDVKTEEVVYWSNLKLGVIALLQVSLFSVLIYYIKKIGILFPFVFKLTDDYVPNHHGEAFIVALPVMALVINNLFTQYNICMREILRRIDRDVRAWKKKYFVNFYELFL